MPVRPFHSLVYEQRRRHLTTFQNLCVDPLSRAIRHGSVRGPHTSAEREQRGASQCSNPTRHRPVANESNHPNPNCACNLQRHLQARPSNGGPPLRPWPPLCVPPSTPCEWGQQQGGGSADLRVRSAGLGSAEHCCQGHPQTLDRKNTGRAQTTHTGDANSSPVSLSPAPLSRPPAAPDLGPAARRVRGRRIDLWREVS